MSKGKKGLLSLASSKSSEDVKVDDKYYNIPSRDQQGHQSRIQFYVPPALAKQASIIVDSGKFPYKGKTALYRHALVFLYEHLENQESFPSELGQIHAVMHMMDDDDRHQSFVDVFDRLQHNVRRHLDNKDEQQATALVLKIYHALNKMPDGFWKTKYLEKMQHLYGHLMKGEKASFNPMTMEE